MSLRFRTVALGLAAGVSLAVFSAPLGAQTVLPAPLSEEAATADDDIPPAALLTERGTELAERLRVLRRIESRMGSRHPSLPGVQQQIAEIKDQLRAWAPAPNPFRTGQTDGGTGNFGETGGDAAGKPFFLMNEEDLRQVVLSLSREVAALRARIDALEQKLRSQP